MTFSYFKNALKNRLENRLDNFRYGSKGKHSHIKKPLRIVGKKRIFLGENVTMLDNCRLETIRFWEKTQLNGVLKIGNHTSFQQGCHIIAAKEIFIGNDCVFSAYIYISDCSHGYNPDENIMDTKLEIKPVRIGNHCFIGIGSCIMPGVELGDYVVVGANSVVTKSTPSYCMIAGSPARIIKKWDIKSKKWIKV